MTNKLFCSLILSALVSLHTLVFGQQRQAFTINSNWAFHKGEPGAAADGQWKPVSIPHSWNTEDVMDDEPGYYRGPGVYKKTLFAPGIWQDKDVYLYFEGAAQVTEVLVNGKTAGKHTGSYNAFSFNIGDLLKYKAGENTPNEIVVKVDNSYNEDIPPLSADFTFFGGLYRDVYLKVLDKVHFDMDNYASSGVFLRTPQVSEKSAELSVKGAFVNRSTRMRNVLITHSILDAAGNQVKATSQKFSIRPSGKLEFAQSVKNISRPHLWSTEDPYLYRVVSTVTDLENNQKLDELSNPLGFRWFSFDPSKGFFLNGKALKLMGASRHQDFKGMGNALSNAMHIHDVELLKEMGGNFLRIAHYPQDPEILAACDRLGILASVETPIVNQITESEAFFRNSREMHREMIRQHYNHPSLIIWAYMNEVLLRPRYEKDSKEQNDYFGKVAQLARQLEDITRKEDPSRYTLIPNHGNFELYNKVGLTKIPQLVGWNLYQGWYSGKLDGFADFLDRHHRELPDKPLLVTEYGSDADNRLHSFDPLRFDKTVEYTNKYHEVYFKAMLERPFVAAGMIWNLAEFNSETRAETMPHINNKGILTLDRKPKDAYRFYQANLLKTPYIQIGSKEWTLRSGFALSETNLDCIQPVLVFSNQPRVTLSLNGKVLGTIETHLGMASFDVPFVNGLNRLVASSASSGLPISDQTDVQFRLLSQNLKSRVLPFQRISVSLGDQRFFSEEPAHEIWLPEQEYRPGSWGYVGGNVFVMKNNGRQSYGSDKNIFGTAMDPVYETQRQGIDQFKFDVPPGDYELVLHFAELLSDLPQEELIYNLGNGQTGDKLAEREFSVSVNGKPVFPHLSNKQDLQPQRAFQSTVKLSVSGDEGITVDFKAIKSESILNGIQLRKTR